MFLKCSRKFSKHSRVLGPTGQATGQALPGVLAPEPVSFLRLHRLVTIFSAALVTRALALLLSRNVLPSLLHLFIFTMMSFNLRLGLIG